LIPVRFVAAVQSDLEGLPLAQLRKVALEWMMRLRKEPHCGQRLRWRRDNDLSSARKIYFDEEDRPLRENFVLNRREGGPRYRIVYQLLPRPERPEVVRILAVGEKRPAEGSGVYERASERL
jgi:hypothetical protein